MINDKIMAGSSLENVVTRLKGCLALLWVLHASSGASSIPEDAINGVCDLLETICRDFQTVVDTAEDYIEKGAGA